MTSSPECSERPSTARVFLSWPAGDGEGEFLEAVNRSASLHHPWVSPPHSHDEYADYLARIRSGRTISFLVRLHADTQLAGVINVNEPVRGTFQSAYLGFYAFAGAERHGYITEGLTLVLDRAFAHLGFHRLEANVQPSNMASKLFVARVGFRKEGFSPRYLFIDGGWRDHERWAILSDEWQQAFASQ